LPKLAQVNGKAVVADCQDVINRLSKTFPELAQVLPKQLETVLHVCEKHHSALTDYALVSLQTHFFAKIFVG
jgi:Na+-transporting NADH:ubiquinone oxidoreductase subunit NqrA